MKEPPLQGIIPEIKSYWGVSRKAPIAEIIEFFNIDSERVLASFGEDAAVLDNGREALLLAADGIMEELMKVNPFWAGYCSVLVNVNDIVAMGGRPIAMVNILSLKKGQKHNEVLRGMKEAVLKFGVPMVGGHTHPDCSYSAIDVAVLGAVKKDAIVFSHTAEVGDDIIFAMDLDGRFTEGLTYSWDTTSFKNSGDVRKRLEAMVILGEKKLLTGGKDISNPGSLGTLGMLLETSGKGGTVDIQQIPSPSNVSALQWLKSYQGCGFVVTAKSDASEEVVSIFSLAGITAQSVGEVDDSNRLTLISGEEKATLFDFQIEKITGCVP